MMLPACWAAGKVACIAHMCQAFTLEYMESVKAQPALVPSSPALQSQPGSHTAFHCLSTCFSMPHRQGTPLMAADEAGEERLAQHLFRLVRCGQVAEACQICREVCNPALHAIPVQLSWQEFQ